MTNKARIVVGVVGVAFLIVAAGLLVAGEASVGLQAKAFLYTATFVSQVVCLIAVTYIRNVRNLRKYL